MHFCMQARKELPNTIEERARKVKTVELCEKITAKYQEMIRRDLYNSDQLGGLFVFLLLQLNRDGDAFVLSRHWLNTDQHENAWAYSHKVIGSIHVKKMGKALSTRMFWKKSVKSCNR
jgi:hypothetical protein